ncbi:hypothetical protein [Pontibacter fetidus]|uniref:Uncharacterized protein n=1 Tax=Pontibacter fetidus TaxID=2700082 RepID=A0A6B2H6J5_9BACT|nr:hypothetical protein [Pontibacter fetidus]NDK56446.1 hypothetical protein [Pontibacter fetidus]
MSASRGSGAARHCDVGAKEAKAAINPKTGPPGREGTKAIVETMGQ